MSDQILPQDASSPKPKRVRQQDATPPADAIPIPGHPGYLIDTRGQVYSCWRGRVLPGTGNTRREIYQSETWYLLRPTREPKGFLAYRMRKDDGRFASVLAHRLVLLAFVGPAPRRRAVAIHLNGNRDDNRLDNLAWSELARRPGLRDRFDPDPAWRPIPGFPGYLATPGGDIYSFWSTRAVPGTNKKDRESFRACQCKFMIPRREHLGYSSHILKNEDGKPIKVWTHRAVLMAFRGLPEPGQESRHLDGNSSNNAIDNLAWGSKSENERDKSRHGTAPLGMRHGMAKLTDNDAREIRQRKAAGESSRQLARAFRVSGATIDGVVARRTWRHVT